MLDAIQEWRLRPENRLSERMIDTEANLSSDIFEKILRIIDIPHLEFASKKNLIDSKLLGRRNPIAHGQKRDILVEEYIEADKEVRLLIEMFQKNIETCIEESAFSKKDLAGSAPS